MEGMPPQHFSEIGPVEISLVCGEPTTALQDSFLDARLPPMAYPSV